MKLGARGLQGIGAKRRESRAEFVSYNELVAFDEVVATLEPELRRFVARKVRAEAVDDVLQEVWVAAWQAMPTFDRRAKMRTWIYGICVHKCHDSYRSQQANARLVPLDDAPLVARGPSIEQATVQTDTVNRLLANLDETQTGGFGTLLLCAAHLGRDRDRPRPEPQHREVPVLSRPRPTSRGRRAGEPPMKTVCERHDPDLLMLAHGELDGVPGPSAARPHAGLPRLPRAVRQAPLAHGFARPRPRQPPPRRPHVPPRPAHRLAVGRPARRRALPPGLALRRRRGLPNRPDRPERARATHLSRRRSRPAAKNGVHARVSEPTSKGFDSRRIPLATESSFFMSKTLRFSPPPSAAAATPRSTRTARSPTPRAAASTPTMSR